MHREDCRCVQDIRVRLCARLDVQGDVHSYTSAYRHRIGQLKERDGDHDYTASQPECRSKSDEVQLLTCNLIGGERALPQI